MPLLVLFFLLTVLWLSGSPLPPTTVHKRFPPQLNLASYRAVFFSFQFVEPGEGSGPDVLQ